MSRSVSTNNPIKRAVNALKMPDTLGFVSIPELKRRIKTQSKSRDNGLAFRCIKNGGDFIERLAQRKAESRFINQENTYLCGPAAFMYCVAQAFPEVYERYVLELAIYGEAHLGKLKVTPSRACKEVIFDPTGYNISDVDWVALGSLRDSTNRFYKMQNFRSGAASITMPGAMKAWFEHSGLFSQVENNTSLVRSGSFDNLLKANLKHKNGAYVCMIIRASIIGSAGFELGRNKIMKDTPKTLLPSPDHWIVQRSPMRINYEPAPFPYLPGNISKKNNDPENDSDKRDQPLNFSIYSWGDYRDLNKRVKTLTPRGFLRYYNGFVSAVPKK